jgi:hypothetical protein
MPTLRISFGELAVTVDLRDTATARTVLDAVPFEATAQTWGEEVYFTAPLEGLARDEDARDVVELGEVAVWVEGSAVALGYGRTPVSRGDEIRLAAPVNVVGTAREDLRALSAVRDGDPVRVERAE